MPSLIVIKTRSWSRLGLEPGRPEPLPLEWIPRMLRAKVDTSIHSFDNLMGFC